MNSTEVYDSNDIMKHFDDLYSKFNFAKPTTDSNVTGNIFQELIQHISEDQNYLELMD